MNWQLIEVMKFRDNNRILFIEFLKLKIEKRKQCLKNLYKTLPIHLMLVCINIFKFLTKILDPKKSQQNTEANSTKNGNAT